MKFTGYISYIYGEEDQYVVEDGAMVNQGVAEIGDLARWRARGSVTSYFSPKWITSMFTTLAFRYVSDINTVATNPIEKVSSYAVFDFILGMENFIVDSMDFTLLLICLILFIFIRN